jgi:iron complex outermembrane receptor protein
MIKSLQLFVISVLFLISASKGNAQESGNPSSADSKPDSVILLDEVKIEAYQFSVDFHHIPGSISRLTPKGINLSDGTNLANALNSIPGITMQSGTYATNRIVIRGMGSRTPYNTNRIRAYLNEIPLTSADGVSSPEDIDIQSIGRLEVIKGPASAIYGSGLGGSIHIFTPVKSGNEFVASSGYGNFNTWNTHLQGTIHTKNMAFWAGLGHLQSDGYRENNHYKRTSFLTSGQWKNKAWEVNPLLMVITADAGIPSSLGKTQFETNPQAAAPAWLEAGGYKKYSKVLTGINVVTKLQNRAVNRFTVFGKWYDGFEKRPFNNLTDNVLSAGIREKATLYFDHLDLIIGTEIITEQYNWKLEKDDTKINENRENRNLINVFAISNYRPVKQLNISIAAAANYISYRLTDQYDANGDQSGDRNFPLIFSPRIGINYAPDDQLAVFASAGHGFSQPSPEETLLPAGDVNPDIKPEKGFQYELGTRLSFWKKRFELEGALYWIELDNLLLTKRLTEDIFIGANAGETRHMGIEILQKSILFNKQQFPGKLTSMLSGTFSRNRFINFTDDGNEYNGNDLPGIPEQNIQLQFTWNPLPALEVFSNFRYFGDQYLNDANTMQYPGYFVADVKISALFPLRKRGNLRFYSGVNNLSDTRYASMLVVNAVSIGNSEPRYYYPGLPRNFYFGLHYQLQ